jgi:HK97 family phage major capsid protein
MPFAPTISPTADLAEVRSKLGEAAQYAVELRTRPADKRDATHAEDVRSAIDFINEFSAIETALTRAAAPVDKAPESKGSRGARVTDGAEFRSIGQQVVEADGYDTWRSGSRSAAFTTEVRQLIGSYTSGAYDTNSDAWLPVNSRALNTPTLQRRRAFIRDLIGVQPTGLASFAYLQESNATTNETGAAMTSEGSAKAEVTMEFTPADAPARKITAWIPVTDEILSDAPTLRGYIDARLEYMLLIREEAQVYNGNGTAPNLQGLKGVSGVQTQTAVSGDYPATIGQAIGKIENVDGEASFAICNPIDYWVAVTKRYSTSFDNSGQGNAPSTAQASITWGLPAIRTRAVASGSALVASDMCATIFERQGTTIKVGDQHSDNFIKNIQVVLAEKRIALPIWRPNLIVDATVPTS